MKHLFLLTITLFLTISSNHVFAGNSTNKRNNCKWGSKRYAVNVHLWCSGYSGGHNGDCNAAYKSVTKTGWNCTTTSTSTAQSDASGQYTSLVTTCSCSGAIYSDLFKDIQQQNEVDEDLDAQQSTFCNSEFTKGNEVVLKNIRIELTSSIFDSRENSITFAVWMPKDDNERRIPDENYDISKAIQESRVILQNGKITVLGNLFSIKEFEVVNKNEITTVRYIGPDKRVRVSSNYNFADVSVWTSGDIQSNETITITRAIHNRDGIINGTNICNIYPNLITGGIINLALNINVEDNLQFKLYDRNGINIYNKDLGLLKNGISNIELRNIATLSGICYAILEGEKTKIVKRIIFE